MAARRTGLALGVAALAATLTACGGGDAPQAAPAPTTAPAATTTVAATTTTTPAAAPATSATTTTAAPSTTYHRNEAVYFTVSAGEFQCGIIELATRVEAGCQGVTDPIPPRPDDCMIDWGSGIRVTGTGPGEFLCAGGVVYTSGDSDPVLPAGESVASFGYTCTAEEDGASCRNDDTGHGFRIAADSNEIF